MVGLNGGDCKRSFAASLANLYAARETEEAASKTLYIQGGRDINSGVFRISIPRKLQGVYRIITACFPPFYPR